MEAPTGAFGEAGVVLPLGAADQVGQALELVLAHELEHDVAVAAPHRRDHERCRYGITWDAERLEVHDQVGERHGRVEHGQVDVLAQARGFAVAECREDADGGEESGGDVGDGAHRIDPRRSVGRPHVVVDARHGLDDRVVGGPVPVGRFSGVAEPRDRDDDGSRMGSGDVVVAEAELRHRPRLEVVGHDVEAGDQAQEEVAAVIAAQVEPQAALVEVVAQERGAHVAALWIGHRRCGTAARLAVHRVLDLDHVGTESGQQLGGERERLHLLGGEDAHAVQRLAVEDGVGVPDFAELHVLSCGAERACCAERPRTP